MTDHLSVRLRLLREERGETRPDLSRVVCMSKESIAGWEAGRRDPDTETVVRLAEHFGVSTDYLLGHGDSRGRRPDDPDTLLAVALSADGALTPEDRRNVQKFIRYLRAERTGPAGPQSGRPTDCPSTGR